MRFESGRASTSGAASALAIAIITRETDTFILKTFRRAIKENMLMVKGAFNQYSLKYSNKVVFQPC